MIPMAGAAIGGSIGVPRVGGGDPELQDESTEELECSPRRRG